MPRRTASKDLVPPIDVCGESWRIVENNSMEEWGQAWPAKRLIEIRTRHDNGARVSAWTIADTLLHELLHAMFHSSGHGRKIRRRLKMTAKQWDRFEESIVEAMTPVLLATLGRAGFLVFPRLPAPPRHRRR